MSSGPNQTRNSSRPCSTRERPSEEDSREDRQLPFTRQYRQGFQGEGFDHQLSAPQATALDNFQFEDEDVTAYEVRAKLTFAGGAAQANIALFRSEFDNLQVSTLQGSVTFNVGNAASAVTQGIEADIRW